MTNLTDADLAAMKARADAAEEGPWFMAHNFDRAMALVLYDSGQEADGRIAHCHDDDDAEFIAHAREDVPALLAEVAALRQQIDLADKAPHARSCEVYADEPCDCWRAEYDAAKEVN